MAKREVEQSLNQHELTDDELSERIVGFFTDEEGLKMFKDDGRIQRTTWDKTLPKTENSETEKS